MQVLLYPLDVIKTNRILNTPLSVKEAGGALPKDLRALYERGAMRGGLYRGVLPVAVTYHVAAVQWESVGASTLLIPALAAACLVNPFAVLGTSA